MFVNECALLRVGHDIEHWSDADEHPAQHGAQLGLQVEARDLTQQRVVAGYVGRKSFVGHLKYSCENQQ